MLLHSFGLKLIYPGSIQLLQSSISGPLQDGRAQFIMEKGAKRHKVVTSEGNHIDTIFFDRRGKNDKNGNTLVISCDVSEKLRTFFGIILIYAKIMNVIFHMFTIGKCRFL